MQKAKSTPDPKTYRRTIDPGSPIRLPNGFKGQIVRRDGNVVLIRKTHPQLTGEFWEVCIVRKTTKDHRYPNGDTLLDGSEFLPSAEQWGIYGWTPGNEDAAKRKFREVSDSQTEPPTGQCNASVKPWNAF